MNKIILSFLLFCVSVTHAQYKKPFFNTLNVTSGLPEAFVQSCIQDKYGYIWMGTQNGLVRYDGYKLKPYSMPDDEGHDIVNSSVTYLYEDREGKLWVHISNEGFYYFDRTKDLFIKQRWKDIVKDSVAKKTGRVFYWMEDKQSQVYWIGVQQSVGDTRTRIFYFDALQNKLEEFSAGGKDKNYIPAYRTIDIKKDAVGKTWVIADSLLSYFNAGTKSFIPWFIVPENPKGNNFESFQPDPVDADILWMNTNDPAFGANQQQVPYLMKLIRFNTKTKQYKIFLPDSTLPGALPANGLQIYTDSLKRIWVLTKKGISLFNRQNATFTNYALPFPFPGGFYVIASDAAGNLWISGENAVGLYYLNTKSGAVTSYKGNGEIGDLHVRIGINQLFFDRSGTFWVSTPFAGISYLDRQKSLFAPIPFTPVALPAAGNTKSSSFSICGNQGDSICFINDTASLWAWHSSTNKYDKIDLKNKDAYRRIVKVVSGKDGSLWIAINRQGLYNYNPLTRSTTIYKQNPIDSFSLSSNILSSLAFDKKGILWLGTADKGICSFNKQTGKFTRYPFIINDGTIKANNALDDLRVISMFFDADGILWIGTNQGALNRFDTKTGKFTSYLDNSKGFSCVLSILEDSHKRLWAGTYLSGLFLFDRKTETFKRYSEKDGLIGNTSFSITEDAAGNIWSFNERGMSRLNPANNTITNFTEFKIDDRSYNNYKDAEGNFHVTTKNGMVSFNPMQLNDNSIPPTVIIESVSYHAANNNTDGDTVLYTEGREKITVAYNENKISFQFVALHFANASQNKYAYQLDGYDKDWVQGGTQRAATYTNLSPGTYTFKVKASNSDGVWNEAGASFTITILPPWWKTWWAYSLYALIVGGAVWSYIQYRSKALRRENLVLEQKISLRTTQLQASIDNLKSTQSQLIQSEKMASLGELTAGIAHEIQNPLNFVNNFSEVSNELIDEMNAELDKGDITEAKSIAADVKQNLEKINHHGKRADAIVKGMLQHSQSSTGKKEPTDINALCDEYLRLSYHGLRAKDKSFNATIKTDFDNTIGKINIIPQDIGRVILNLLTNAFYVVNEKKASTSSAGEPYEPTVSITTKKVNDKVEIKVSDNGNGIPPKVLDKIFQPFFTTKPTGQGTGLGLSLAYDIVKAHGGEITVESAGGAGTTFKILLPLKN